MLVFVVNARLTPAKNYMFSCEHINKLTKHVINLKLCGKINFKIDKNNMKSFI